MLLIVYFVGGETQPTGGLYRNVKNIAENP